MRRYHLCEHPNVAWPRLGLLTLPSQNFSVRAEASCAIDSVPPLTLLKPMGAALWQSVRAFGWHVSAERRYADVLCVCAAPMFAPVRKRGAETAGMKPAARS